MLVRRSFIAALAVLGTAALTGCPSADSRTGNQGGGSLISAGAKVAGGSMTDLTADEIQILGDVIATRSTRFAGVEITDEQATAAVDFLEANDLNTVNEIKALVDNPGSITIPDSVQALLDAGLATSN